MESKFLSVCCKLVRGKYPRDDTLVEKLYSTLVVDLFNFQKLFECDEMLEFLGEIQCLEKNRNPQALSAVIRILGILWKHQPQDQSSYRDQVMPVLHSWLIKDATVLPKTVLHALLCCMMDMVHYEYGQQSSFLMESLPFVESCLKEGSLFVRNVAMDLLIRLTVHSLPRRRDSSPHKYTEKHHGKSDTITSNFESGMNDSSVILTKAPDGLCQIERNILECFENHFKCLNEENKSSKAVVLGLVLRLCQYLEDSAVYEYVLDSLHLLHVLVEVSAFLQYADLLTSLEVFSTFCKYRRDAMTTSLLERLLVTSSRLLSQDKSLESALLTGWILQHCPVENEAACSGLLATMQACLRTENSNTYIRMSVKTMTRCLASVQYMKCRRDAAITLLSGVLNPDLAVQPVTSVTESPKVQAGALDALATLTHDASFHEIKSILHTGAYLLRYSEVNYQKVSKTLTCILKAITELKIIQQHNTSGSDKTILLDKDISNLLSSLFNSSSTTNRSNPVQNQNRFITSNGNITKSEKPEYDFENVDGMIHGNKNVIVTGRPDETEYNAVDLCLHSIRWEVRDTALEFVGSLAKLATGFPGLQGWLSQCEFISAVWSGVEDTESYVRASALTALLHWLQQECTHTLVMADLSQETILTTVMKIAEHDSEAFPRRAAIDFLSTIFQLTVWPSANAPVLKLMQTAIHDQDWEVKSKVLNFWEVFIRNTSQNLEHSGMIPAYVVDLMPSESDLGNNGENESDFVEKFAQKIYESGLPGVLFSAIQDCDPAVQEKACVMLKSVSLSCRISERQKSDIHVDGSDPFSTGINDGVINTVEKFMFWLHQTDVDGLLRQANQNAENSRESVDALLDDILMALGDVTEDCTTGEDNNAAAIDCY